MKHDGDERLAARYGPWAVIAGASEGIGEAVAHRLAAAGVDLILIARNESRLRAVAQDIETRHGRNAIVLPLDLTDPDMHRAAAQSCRDLEVACWCTRPAA